MPLTSLIPKGLRLNNKGLSADEKQWARNELCRIIDCPDFPSYNYHDYEKDLIRFSEEKTIEKFKDEKRTTGAPFYFGHQKPAVLNTLEIASSIGVKLDATDIISLIEHDNDEDEKLIKDLEKEFKKIPREDEEARENTRESLKKQRKILVDKYIIEYNDFINNSISETFRRKCDNIVTETRKLNTEMTRFSEENYYHDYMWNFSELRKGEFLDELINRLKIKTADRCINTEDVRNKYDRKQIKILNRYINKNMINEDRELYEILKNQNFKGMDLTPAETSKALYRTVIFMNALNANFYNKFTKEISLGETRASDGSLKLLDGLKEKLLYGWKTEQENLINLLEKDIKDEHIDTINKRNENQRRQGEYDRLTYPGQSLLYGFMMKDFKSNIPKQIESMTQGAMGRWAGFDSQFYFFKDYLNNDKFGRLILYSDARDMMELNYNFRSFEERNYDDNVLLNRRRYNAPDKFEFFYVRGLRDRFKTTDLKLEV